MEQDKRTRVLGLRLSAVVEFMVVYAILILLDYAFFGADRYWDVTPHPFWAVIILIAAQYGTAEAIGATLVGSLLLLVGNMPEMTYGQDMYDYLLEVLWQPILWVVFSVLIGEIRNRHIRERNDLLKDLHDSREREHKIADSYEWVRDLKERLELQVAGQLHGSITTYKAAKAIETLDPQAVMSGVQELVRSVMSPEKFSIFSLNGDRLETLIISGWGEGDHYLRELDSSNPLYRAVIGEQQTLNAANDIHDSILAGEGIIAGPLIDAETGQIAGMLKIEKMGFTDLNLSTVETFKAICEWVGMAMVNANKYQLAKDGSVINPDHNLMTPGYFRRYVDYITALAKRQNFSVSMLIVKLLDAESMDAKVRMTVARQLSEVVDGVLRAVDLAFDYQQNDGEYSIVLPCTDRKGAKIVQEKIEQGLAGRGGRALRNVGFSFTVQTIHEA